MLLTKLKALLKSKQHNVLGILVFKKGKTANFKRKWEGLLNCKLWWYPVFYNYDLSLVRLYSFILLLHLNWLFQASSVQDFQPIISNYFRRNLAHHFIEYVHQFISIVLSLKGLLVFIPKFYMIIVPMSTLMKSI